MKYMKLTKAIDDHGYVVDYFDQDGNLVKTEPIELKELDRLVKSKRKLRCKGDQWGLMIYSRDHKLQSVLPISKPSKVS